MNFFKKMVGGREKGVDCIDNPDGSFACNVFEKEGNELIATGTSFNGQMVDCEPVLNGHNRISEDDREIVDKMLQERRKGCRVKPGVA